MKGNSQNPTCKSKGGSKRLVGVNGLAEYTGLAVGTIYNMVAMGAIPYFKPTRRLMFDLNMIDEWIDDSFVPVLEI